MAHPGFHKGKHITTEGEVLYFWVGGGGGFIPALPFLSPRTIPVYKMSS